MPTTGLPANLTTAIAGFLQDVKAQKGRWRETDTHFDGLATHYHWTGQGRDALEVALATSTRKLTATEARSIWKARQGRSAAPLLTIVAYPTGSDARAVVCGPSGESPTVADLDLNQAERLAASALSESNRHLAAQMIQGALEQTSEELPGLRNKGLLATHELLSGVPRRADWDQAVAKGRAILHQRDHDLIRALGYQLQQTGSHQVLRTTTGNARAIAVFLQDNEQPDQPSFRYGMQTPVTYALAQADRENLPWVISVRGSALRLYSATTSGAVGQRGRAETFVELDLSLLPSDKAGYLHLLYSSEALTQDGTFYEIQQASRDFTTGLSERLRERVYEQVVPRLALTIAKQAGGTDEADLARHYRTALTILFRLLFISYAEDSKLLPLHINGEYTDNSLKSRAIHFSEAINAGRDLGFDNPFTGGETEHPDTIQDDLWRDCQMLFQAVDKGHQRWGVPAYNGGLFSPDPNVNPVGGIIAELDLKNADFGPALAALIVDRTPDGAVGPIDFRSLSVREFGTIYEGLLESELSVAEQDLTLGKDETYLPAKEGDAVVVPAGDVYLHNKSGQRKATGSYFTKPFAVDHLLDHALTPTLDEHLERVARLLEKEKEADAADMLFDFRVADISMGSGHFLTAVVDRIEAQVSRFLAEHPISQVTAELDDLRGHATQALGDTAPSVEIENASLLRRLIARRCVYGVDLNPISVELARVSMWIHTFVPGLPLSFLNHNLAVGDSLTGIATIEEATKAVVQENAAADGTQFGLFNDPLLAALGKAEEPLERLARLVDATPKDIEAARKTAAEIEAAVEPVTAFFDVTVAVRLGRRQAPIISSDDDLLGLTRDASRSVAQELKSLHFPVAFPEVFLRERPGFDVIVGNPPWEEATLEEHAFWARHFPGLRGLPSGEQEARKARLRIERPDLVAAYEMELEAMSRRRKILLAGPFPGMGTGDPDLYKAFAWRFWHLLRAGGRMGVVLPRSVLSAKGSTEFRQTLLDGSDIIDVTFLLNSQGWAFDDAEYRYTIGLIAASKTSSGEGSSQGELRLQGPYRSLERYRRGMSLGLSVLFSSRDVAQWNDTASLPLVPTEDSVEVFAQLRNSPRLDLDDGLQWRARPYSELHATNDKKRMDLESVGRPTGSWPVYKGETFNLWDPESGPFYGWADSESMVAHLQEKRLSAARNRLSPFSEFDATWVQDPSTLPCLHPRIAFRDSARANDTRTVIAALVPPNVFIANQAPYILMPRGTARDEAYLLGVLSSLPLDWYARRFVENHVNFFVFNPFPIPRPRSDNPLWERAVAIAGRLAAIDERYATWAAAVGVDVGSLPADEKQDLTHELDAVVAHLYGLTEAHLTHVFETFHEGWDYEERLLATLQHFHGHKGDRG